MQSRSDHGLIPSSSVVTNKTSHCIVDLEGDLARFPSPLLLFTRQFRLSVCLDHVFVSVCLSQEQVRENIPIPYSVLHEACRFQKYF